MWKAQVGFGRACEQKPIETMLGQFFFWAFFLGPIGDEQKSQRGQISHEKGSKKLRTGTHEKQIGPYALSTRLVTEWFLKPYFGFWPKWPVEKN